MRCGNSHPNGVRFISMAIFVAGAWTVIHPEPAAADEITSAAPGASGVEHALIFDLTKLVHLRGQRGWLIDKHDLHALLPDALMSVCIVPPVAAASALQLLNRRIIELGGPVEQAWEREKRSLEPLEELLIITRTRDLLTLAARSIADCAFYMKPDARFVSRQADAEHVTVNVEGGGLFSFRRSAGIWNLGGGGAGRITVGYGFGPRWAARTGLEVGGAALVSESISAESVNVNFFVAVPVTLRRLTPTWHYDFEAAAIGLGVPWREDLRYGVRIGALVGQTYPRVLALLPWGGYAISFEYVLPRGAQGGQWTVRMGLRVGFNLRAGRP
jgi:hypothetical protein